jgi:MFS family permease
MEVRFRLSVMMFLQFAVWGAWFVVFFDFLLKMGFSGGEAGWIFGNMALAAIISPMIIGVIADRFIASEKLMALLHFAGAAVLFLQAQLGYQSGFFLYFTVALVYALIYNPTLILANSISFTHVPDATRDFPGLRVWGTIGWIVVNFIGGMTLNLESNQPLLLAAVLSAILGAFSLALPHTPPTGKAGDPLPFVSALGLFKNWSFAVFFVVSGLITVVLAFYYSNTASYLQQTDGRMIPTDVRGYFGNTVTLELKQTAPEKGEVKPASALVRSVTSLVIATGTADADGKPQNIQSRRKLVFPKGANIRLQFEPDLEHDDLDLNVLAVGATDFSELQVKEEKEKDGKKVIEWEPRKGGSDSLFDGGTLAHVDLRRGQSVFLTIERLAINPATTMLWGQICEMVLLPLLPLFLLRFGMKWVLAFGMLAWGLRYLLFAAGYPAGPFWIIFVGVLLHGICFDFFFAAGFIHVDNTAPKDIRASAQALFGLLTYGVGMWVGSILSGYLNQYFTTPSLVPTVDWFRFWQVPAYGVIAAVIVFVLLFHIEPKKKKAA